MKWLQMNTKRSTIDCWSSIGWRSAGQELCPSAETPDQANQRSEKIIVFSRWTMIFAPLVLHKYLPSNICYFRSPFSPWRGPQWKSLFWAFLLDMIPFFTMQNFNFRWGPLLPFWEFFEIVDKFCLLLGVWYQKWMRNKLLLLHFFSTFLNCQRATLTYSALGGKLSVQKDSFLHFFWVLCSKKFIDMLDLLTESIKARVFAEKATETRSK